MVLMPKKLNELRLVCLQFLQIRPMRVELIGSINDGKINYWGFQYVSFIVMA